MKSGIAWSAPIVEPEETSESNATEAPKPSPECELVEFLSGELQPDQADPDFRRGLEEKLWELVSLASRQKSDRR
ncbi:MAG: hypothetical protein U0900_15305 [Myxococcota bacterium]